MKDFADIIGGTAGTGKTLEEIRATTGKIPMSANHIYGAKVPEWDATLPNVSQLTRDDFIRSVEPHNDRILVQLIEDPQVGEIILTDHKPLIGGCRKARVLKTGPGKWIEGEWWKDNSAQLKQGKNIVSVESSNHYWSREGGLWNWFPGFRRHISVTAGQIVLIGNWVDLELEDIALCQEMDVRAIVGAAWPN